MKFNCSPNTIILLPAQHRPFGSAVANRVQSITYPDGEVVKYKYDRGGMLRNMEGQKGTQTFKYIDKIYYNRYGLKDAQWYGNGTHAHYTYDILQRLSHLTAYNSANTAMQDITYTYDKANNITQISNAAGIVNTLGDTYSYDYTYDSLYRLTYSFGSVGRGKPLANYTLNMQYEADGRITQKNQSGRTRLNGTVRTFNDSKNYTYNTSQPHTLQTVGSTNYQWDANGNMVKDGGAVLTWDEENRLKEVNKSAYGVCFLYDAGGERFYKNSGSKQIMLVNGLYYMNLPLYDDPVLYTSPYLVATPDGYTKHYFVESERFASRIGDGTITGLNTHATTASALAAKQAQVNDAAPDSIRPDKLSNLRSLPFNWSAHHTTYWQHSDHLGSASWVTDTNGAAYQHLQYMPWGEPLLDQRKSGYTYNTRYTFSGKERDEETGYSYFGARHYNSDLSIWLSVDPMADKYPSTSPYAYCANNPVKLVDPNGRDIWEITQNTKDNKKYLIITKVKNTTDFDRIDVIVNGETIKGIEKQYGTVREHRDGDKMFFFDINNDEMAKKIFENLADNTSFEWTRAEIGEEGSNRNVVGTSYSEESTCIGEYLFSNGYILRSVTHNHPSGSGWPSNRKSPSGANYGDLIQAKKYEEKFPNIKLYIYVNGSHPKSEYHEWCQKGYHPYNSLGPIFKDTFEISPK